MKRLLAALIMLQLSACGSTSGIKNINQDANKNFDLSRYEYLIVNDFKDGVSKSGNDKKIQSEGVKFADSIAKKISAKNIFKKVDRNKYDNSKGLLIDGKITELEEGDSTLRLMVGMGAGSSHFDAKVNLRDNSTKNLIGIIDVDQMSWALGGGLAATQDINHHINTSSDKIAEDVADAMKK